MSVNLWWPFFDFLDLCSIIIHDSSGLVLQVSTLLIPLKI